MYAHACAHVLCVRAHVGVDDDAGGCACDTWPVVRVRLGGFGKNGFDGVWSSAAAAPAGTAVAVTAVAETTVEEVGCCGTSTDLVVMVMVRVGDGGGGGSNSSANHPLAYPVTTATASVTGVAVTIWLLIFNSRGRSLGVRSYLNATGECCARSFRGDK